jgi:hypothetical protein
LDSRIFYARVVREGRVVFKTIGKGELQEGEHAWLCTKNPVSTLTHKSIRPFWSYLEVFSRPERPIYTPKNPMRERLLVQSQESMIKVGLDAID